MCTYTHMVKIAEITDITKSNLTKQALKAAKNDRNVIDSKNNYTFKAKASRNLLVIN